MKILYLIIAIPAFPAYCLSYAIGKIFKTSGYQLMDSPIEWLLYPWKNENSDTI